MTSIEPLIFIGGFFLNTNYTNEEARIPRMEEHELHEWRNTNYTNGGTRMDANGWSRSVEVCQWQTVLISPTLSGWDKWQNSIRDFSPIGRMHSIRFGKNSIGYSPRVECILIFHLN